MVRDPAADEARGFAGGHCMAFVKGQGHVLLLLLLLRL
jgi:hypothetical protein